MSMIAEPNTESPANVDAAKMWREDKVSVPESGSVFPPDTKIQNKERKHETKLKKESLKLFAFSVVVVLYKVLAVMNTA